MTKELDKQALVDWLNEEIESFDQEDDKDLMWAYKYTKRQVEKGKFDSNRVAELEEQLKQAVGLLEEAEEYIFAVVQSCKTTEFIDYDRVITDGDKVLRSLSSLSQGTEEKMICPLCDRDMHKFLNEDGWICDECDVFTKKRGRDEHETVQR